MAFDVYFRERELGAKWQLETFDDMEKATDFMKSVESVYETESYKHVEEGMFILDTKTMKIRKVKDVTHNTVILEPDISDILERKYVDHNTWQRKNKELYKENIMVVDNVNYLYTGKYKEGCIELSTGTSSIVKPLEEIQRKTKSSSDFGFHILKRREKK